MIYCLVIPTFLNLVKPEIFFFWKCQKIHFKEKEKEKKWI